jgi:hypothetical protein
MAKEKRVKLHVGLLVVNQDEITESSPSQGWSHVLAQIDSIPQATFQWYE